MLAIILIPRCSCQIFALAVGDMLAISLNVPLGQAKVQDEDLVASLVQADTKVIGLDISVNEVSVMDVLDSLDHLVNQYEHSLKRELPEGLVEQRLK